MDKSATDKLYATANALALLTIAYNVVEGAASVWFGVSDETLSLFAFGVDSFVEVISAVGVWHMVRRLRQAAEGENRDPFERQALRITGAAFYLLAAGLLFTASWDIFTGHRPETTMWGIIVGIVSISCMWLLVRFKVKTGKALGSRAIIADAACSRVCMLLSLVLLLASVGFELTGIGIFDSLGSLVIAWFAAKEGREAFEKARGAVCACHGSCSSGASG